MKKEELKYLIKEIITEYQDKVFNFVGLQFDIEKAEKIIATHPREMVSVDLKGIVSGIMQYKNSETGEKSYNSSDTKDWKKYSANIGVRVDLKAKKHPISNEPGIVATIGPSLNKVFKEPSYLFIDGHHRALDRYLKGEKEMSCYILTEKETKSICNL